MPAPGPAAQAGPRHADRAESDQTPSELPLALEEAAGSGGEERKSPVPRSSSSVRRSARPRRTANLEAGSPRAAVPDPGADLERRVARLEFAEGALARLRVPVRVDADPGRGVLTDLDVLALDVDGRLRITRSILECKSGKGQAGEPDRLLWLAGLRRFVSADRAVLVRQTTTRRGRAVAEALALQVLDVAVLAEREAAHAWVPVTFAHVDGQACSAVEARTDLQLKGLASVPAELVTFLRHDALTATSYRALAALKALGRTARAAGVLPEPTALVLGGHALVALLLAALQDAGTLDTGTEGQLRRRLELSLTVGSPDDDHVLDVLDRADQLVDLQMRRIHEAYVRAGAAQLDVPTTSLRALVAAPPNWIDRYLDLVHRLRANPSVAKDLTRTAELACFDALPGDQGYLAAAFDHLFTAEHRHLLLVALRLLHDIIGGQLADRVSPLLDLDFGRAAPSLPERTSTPAPSAPRTPRTT